MFLNTITNSTLFYKNKEARKAARRGTGGMRERWGVKLKLSWVLFKAQARLVVYELLPSPAPETPEVGHPELPLKFLHSLHDR